MEESKTFDDDIYGSESNVNAEKNPIKKYLTRYKNFMNAPKVHFFYDSVTIVNSDIFIYEIYCNLFFASTQVSYFVFLVFFSYMLLCDFKYAEYVDVTIPPSNSSLNSTDNTTDLSENIGTRVKMLKVVQPSWLQYLLVFWVFTILCEELRQVIPLSLKAVTSVIY